jgi:FAD:protein FMN transferase
MYSFKAMNTDINTYYLNEKISKQVESWFHFSENVFSRFKPESELSQLNRTNGRLFLPSTILFDLLATANLFYKETDGLFNPFLEKIICDLGYDKSFEKLNHPSIKVHSSIRNISENPLIIDNSMKSITLINGSVDLGGIAKGWTAQQISNQLKHKGILSGAIAAGGDIVLWGAMEKGWDITIAQPRQLEQDLFSLNIVRAAGVATSSTFKRSWHTVDGHVLHHIVDPRTLNSSKSDLIQVTILAPDLTTAEVYAKCLLILGWEAGLKWLESKSRHLGAIGVKSDNTIVFSGAIDKYCPEGVIEIEPTIS